MGFYVKFDSLRRQWQQQQQRRQQQQQPGWWKRLRRRRRKQHSAHMYGIFKSISIDSIMLVAHSDAKQRNNSHGASLATTTTTATAEAAILTTIASKSNRVKTWKKNFYSVSLISPACVLILSFSHSQSLFVFLSSLHSLWFVFFFFISCLVSICSSACFLFLLAVRLGILLFYLSGRKSEQRELGTGKEKEWNKRGKRAALKEKLLSKWLLLYKCDTHFIREQ